MNQHREGVLPAQYIQQLMEQNIIQGGKLENIQPASLDLSISGEIYRMRGTYLPRQNESIRELIKHGVLFETSLDRPLELNGIYLIRLNEALSLTDYLYARTNNKSSTGRVNLQTRLLIDGVSSFDFVPRGYRGELWLEVIPKSFPIKLSADERLNQLRFFNGSPDLPLSEYKDIYDKYGLLRHVNGVAIPQPSLSSVTGLPMTIDLSSADIIGYKCTPTMSKILDYSRRDHDILDFFEAIERPRNGELIMKKDEFYIFVTKEGVRVPNEYSVEMLAYDVSKGEFRSHYAGFFDPGFGFGESGETLGSPAVLEVFTHDSDFILRDGQPICQMIYERLIEPTTLSYGDPKLCSNYYKQTGPKLSKHFKQNI